MKTSNWILAALFTCFLGVSVQAHINESEELNHKQNVTKIVSYEFTKALQDFSPSLPLMAGNEVMISFKLSEDSLVVIEQVKSKNPFLAQYVRKVLERETIRVVPLQAQTIYKMQLRFKA